MPITAQIKNNLSPASPEGEEPLHHPPKHRLGNSAPIHRTATKKIPSPEGEGQTDFSIITLIRVSSSGYADQNTHQREYPYTLIKFT